MTVHDAVKQTKYVALFGVGSLLDQCINQVVLAIGKKPDYIVDNDPTKWNKVYFGVECVSPEQLSLTAQDTLVIITARCYEKIAQQLKLLGVEFIFNALYERSSFSVNNLILTPKHALENKPVNTSHLKGKTALITGASRGIGFQIAVALAKLGVNIIAHSRAISHTEKVVSACEQQGVKVIALAAKLDIASDVDRLLTKVDNVDILVNCAGVSIASNKDWFVEHADFMSTLSINTIAAIRLCNQVLPSMKRRKFGRIVNVSSSIHQKADQIAYSCSKAALDRYTSDIAPSLHGTGIAICSIDPGWLKTDMGGDAASLSVDTVIPGALLGIIMSNYKPGVWFSAQDYRGLTVEQAVAKARLLFQQPIDNR